MLPGDVVIELDSVEINGVDDLIRALDRDRIDQTQDGCAADGPPAARSTSIGRTQAGGATVVIVAAPPARFVGLLDHHHVSTRQNHGAGIRRRGGERLAGFRRVIMSRSPRMNVVGTLTCAAAASAFW